jgi:hypothetical protein
LARLVPSGLLPLPLPLPLPLALVGCIDREEAEERGATGRLVPTPTAGDMDRGGTFGGGPVSAPGDRRCEVRVEFISGFARAGCLAVALPLLSLLTLDAQNRVHAARNLNQCSMRRRDFRILGGWAEVKAASWRGPVRVSLLLPFDCVQGTNRRLRGKLATRCCKSWTAFVWKMDAEVPTWGWQSQVSTEAPAGQLKPGCALPKVSGPAGVGRGAEAFEHTREAVQKI